jgi:hypothetical protein
MKMARIPEIWLIASGLAGAAVVWWAEAPDPARAPDPANALEAGLPLQAGRSASARAATSDRRSTADRSGDASPASIEYRRRFEAGDVAAADRHSLLSEWARNDPAGFLAALPTLDFGRVSRSRAANGPPYVDALRLATEADPRYALAVGERQAGDVATWVRTTALEALAAEDPDAALDYLAGIEAAELRERLLASLATGFARFGLDAAVAWLATLDETDGAAVYPVIDAVAVVDLPRAIELDARAMELDYGGLDYGDTAWLRAGLAANRQDPARIADLLASMYSTGLLADTLGWWGQSDPYGAIAWIQSQQTISSYVIGRMAGELADRDYQTAMALGTQFSPAVRAAWIESVIGSAAPYDLAGALDALEPYRDRAFFEDTFSRILDTANRTLGPADAALIAGNAPPAWIATRIASDWSDLDPLAAANWALAIEDKAVRASALRSVVLSWAAGDAGAAEGWVLGIADDTLRQTMLSHVCSRTRSCAPKF